MRPSVLESAEAAIADRPIANRIGGVRREVRLETPEAQARAEPAAAGTHSDPGGRSNSGAPR
jgi:hypothetical protein